MAENTSLLALINAYIKKNGNQEITGPVLNGVLRAIAYALSTPFIGEDGYWYAYNAETGAFEKTDTPAQGPVGPVGVTEAGASIDSFIGTPSVEVSLNGTRLDFSFHNLKGQKGDTGNPGITNAVVTVDATIGTPSVSANIQDTTLYLAFSGLKGEQGIQGIQGVSIQSVQQVTTSIQSGGTNVIRVTLDNGQAFDFQVMNGQQGNSGYQGAAGELEVVNNLTDGGATKALSAEMGKTLESEVSQLSQKVDDLSTGKYYGYFAKEEDLPEADVDGFAYVGEGPTYTIYNCVGGVWTSSDITVNQSPIGNDEDIDQNEDGKLQFANRVYNAQQPNGMGYKILRKDATFASQVTETNTIYEIRYDFDLNGGTVTIPSGCVLKFNGGKLRNGTLSGTSTKIEAQDGIFDSIVFSGTFINEEVSPEWFVASDTNMVKAAVALASVSGDAEVIIRRKYDITSTISGVVNMTFTGGGGFSIRQNVDGLVIAKDNAEIKGGTIGVSISGYTGKVITLSSPLSSVKINNVTIIGYSYQSPSGTGIYIGTSGGRQYGHNFDGVSISNMDKGFDIDSSGNWANSFNISSHIQHNNVSVNIHGSNESCKHHVNLVGQAPLSVSGGCIVRDENNTSGSTWFLSVFDVGFTGYISTLIDIKRGYVFIPEEQVIYCVHSGTWRHSAELPYSGADSCVNNCDTASWAVKSIVGNASDLQTARHLLDYGQATNQASDALAWCTQESDGMQIEFTFPQAITIFAIVLCANINNAPQKVVITATGNGGTETVEIAGDRIVGGRTFRSSELLTWRSQVGCSKIIFKILGTPNNSYPGYCRMKYIGVVDTYFRKFTP